jgi:SAM-dependent methyltransferase
MTVQRAVIAAIVRQFGHPQGAGGRVAGWVLAHRPSNRQRNSWAVSLLDVQPTDRILEIGFGPGLAIAELSRRIGDSGHVYGVDHSDVMLQTATRRNASAIAAGRVTLRRSVRRRPHRELHRVLAGTDRATRRAAPTTQTRRAHRNRLPTPRPRSDGDHLP